MDNEFISKVFKYLGIGIMITFLIAYIVSVNETLIYFVYQGPTLLILGVLEIFSAFFLSVRVTKMSSTTATILYYGYAALTGLTLSSIFIIYKLTSIIYIFLATALIFLIFSIIGKRIKLDLSRFGTYLLIGLLSIIVLEIINIFLLNSSLDMFICIVSLIIFMVYIAYDIQNVVRKSEYTICDNLAIIGAFSLYLDVINIFTNLIHLFGDEK